MASAAAVPPAVEKLSFEETAALALPAEFPRVDISALASASPASIPAEALPTTGWYRVPKVAPGGSCSMTHDLEETPVDILRDLFGVDRSDVAAAVSSPAARRLHLLQQVVNGIQAATGAEWVGVYRVVYLPAAATGSGATAASSSGAASVGSGRGLVKEAYVGSPSRAFFPMTEEFAARSNNSTVRVESRRPPMGLLPLGHQRCRGVRADHHPPCLSHAEPYRCLRIRRAAPVLYCPCAK